MRLPKVSVARRQLEDVYSEALDAVEAKTIRLGFWHATCATSVSAEDCKIWYDKWLSERIGVPPTYENQTVVGGEAVVSVR